MAELEDAYGSDPYGRKAVEVQVLLPAQLVGFEVAEGDRRPRTELCSGAGRLHRPHQIKTN